LLVRTHGLAVFLRERDAQPFELFGVTGEPVFDGLVLRLNKVFALDEGQRKSLTSFLVFLYHFSGEPLIMPIGVKSVLCFGAEFTNKCVEFFAVLLKSRRVVANVGFGHLPTYGVAIFPSPYAALIGGAVAASAGATMYVQVRYSTVRFHALVMDTEP